MRISREQHVEILEATKDGDSNFTSIGEELGIHRETVRKYAGLPLADSTESEEKFETLLYEFNKWIGDAKPASKKAPYLLKSEKKNLVLNDLHSPFHDEEALAKAIGDNLDADEVWIAGDLQDLFGFSRYDKYVAPFSPVEEFQSSRVIIRTLSEKFPKVKVMSGNHDDRFLKYLVRDKKIPTAILDFFKMQDENFLSPLAKICAPFKNVEVIKPIELDYSAFPFIAQFGDCILSHAEKFSKVPNKAVGQVIHWLKSYCEPQGLVEPFKMVVQAHTHQAGKTWNDYGVVGIEAGCLALSPDYAGDPKLGGAERPTVTGYTLIYQKNGVTDINKSNFIQII